MGQMLLYKLQKTSLAYLPDDEISDLTLLKNTKVKLSPARSTLLEKSSDGKL